MFFCIYWACRFSPKLQNILLVIASYAVIYLMANEVALLSIFLFSVMVFVLSKMMQRFEKYKKMLMMGGIFFTVMQLFLFKFYDFFRPHVAYSLEQLQLDSSGLAANILLPLGLSYYSFQAISYLVSCYQANEQTEPLKFDALLLHFSFFCTITAGPIARVESAKGLTDINQQPCGMREQICSTQKRHILWPSLAFLLLALALIKKWWLATWLADSWVNPVFSNPMQYHSLEILAAIYGYTVQLFLDFSGYSEMMIAFALLLGFRLPVNFRAPLLAHNIREFWNRWHISLSTWIRDYIYIPLGGNRGGFMKTQVNLLSAMVLSGIWHGSGWNFLLWGLFHGLALVLLNTADLLYTKIFKVTVKEAQDALYRSSWLGKALGIVVTIHFVCFCFVFFRAKTFDEAINVFQSLFHNTHNVPWSSNPLYFISLLLLSWILYPFARKLVSPTTLQDWQLPKYRLFIPLLLVFVLILVCAPSGIPGFIYANF
ncbi:MBOAT family O-acyltransferase [Acinetobacter rathckeae]|uniref:MBOAT family O-acyltransferase n=1 Tax=Acinetobacter rathckeae TaxID=2605272 RepID=UPI002B1BD2F0|nr:MBOAT family O-acyltransferase [Acinetobacter rathckeae]